MATVLLELNLPDQSDRTFAANMRARDATFLWEKAHPTATAVAIIDPDAPIATGDVIAVIFGPDVIMYGRLATKHPAKAKRFDVTILTVHGPVTYRRFAQRTDAKKVVGISYLSLA